MKHVFTDQRFPGFEVHNDGSVVFRVYERVDGQLQEVDVFKTYGGNVRVTQEDAAKRATAYFNRMASGSMSDELAQRDIPADRDHSDIFNNPTPPPSTNLSKRASLDDIVGNKVLTSDDVLAYYNQVKSITDPEEKRKGMEQIRQMASRLESEADDLVRRLIG